MVQQDVTSTPSGQPRRWDATIGTGSAADLIREARDFEALGIDTCWASQLHHTPFAPLAAVAGATDRIQLGSAIALAFTRSPMETALTALDMDRLSDGRFKLGLGAGVKRLNEEWHGVSDFGRPAPHLKETVELVRLLIEQGAQGEPVRYRGRYHQVELAGWKPRYEPVRTSIPLYIAGVGEAMARVAGDVANGLLGHRVWSFPWLRDVIAPNVALGLARSGRQRSDFDLALTVPVCLAGGPISVDQARRDAASGVAFYASMQGYRQIFERHGFAAQADAARRAYQSDGWGETVIDSVDGDMLNEFCIAGSLDGCAAQLERYWAHADSIRLEPGGHQLPPDRVHAYRESLAALICER